MKVKVELWTISKFITLRERINEQPVYQRGEVWPQAKKKHLIDSLLRGIDIPKIYLRKLKDGPFDYEVADGQQRLTAIVKYLDDKYNLDNKLINGLNLAEVDGYIVGGKKYSQLPQTLRDNLQSYELTIAIVEEASGDEIRTLFNRLQLGSSLNQAEKRNAIISVIGDHINMFALNHVFFVKSKIPASRYRRQDLLAHVVAMMKFGNTRDLKATLLEKLYLDTSISLNAVDLKDIDLVLEQLHELDKVSPIRIVNKFTFIDFCLFFYTNIRKLNSVDYEGLANTFSSLEADRKAYQKNEPEQLLLKPNPSPYDLNLYKYIDAFNKSGSEQMKIGARAHIFNEIFTQYLN